MQEVLNLTKSNKNIFERSFKNCHVVGLHGIVFAQEGEYLTRMFVTTKNHVLHENECLEEHGLWGSLSLAIHPHRIDIEIHVVSGEVWNI